MHIVNNSNSKTNFWTFHSFFVSDIITVPMSSHRDLLPHRVPILLHLIASDWVFHDVLLCLVSHAMIGITDHQSSQGWAIMPQKWTHAKLRTEWTGRSGKSSHISMISNSVTYLQSYTNSAIAGNFMPDVDIATPSVCFAASCTDVCA